MAANGSFEKGAIEVHDDDAKELDAGLRPLDHYKQVLAVNSHSLCVAY
jgi:hypothetical protein